MDSTTPQFTVLTCQTKGCENQSIPITFEYEPDFGGAICGPCGRPIVSVSDLFEGDPIPPEVKEE